MLSFSISSFLVRSSAPSLSTVNRLASQQKSCNNIVSCLGSRASISFFKKSKELESADLVKSAEGNDSSLETTGQPEKNLFLDSVRGPLPIITKRELTYLPDRRTYRQAWVENLDTLEEKKLGLVDLHPDVFGTFPRVELIHENVKWQQLYKKVDWNWTPTRGELFKTTRKPWPQKGLGRARHGSRTAPQWKGGGKAHGPRGPTSYFYMLKYDIRVHGLTSTLSVKLAQDDLKIVDNLDIPTEDPKFIQDLVETRKWGLSVLFVDDTDLAPRNLALATDPIGHMNIMPLYGLNVYSMLKHETLVLTLAALNKLEEKLVQALNRNNMMPPTARRYG